MTNKADSNHDTRTWFTTIKKEIEYQDNLVSKGFHTAPWDPLLPINNTETWYKESKEIKKLVKTIIAFATKKDSSPLLFLIGPRGSGKSTFGRIMNLFSSEIGIKASYIDGRNFFQHQALEKDDFKFKDLLIVDNADSITKTLLNIDSFGTDDTTNTKILAIFDSTPFEIFRRRLIVEGNSIYQNHVMMPRLSTKDIYLLLEKRMTAAKDTKENNHSDQWLKKIAYYSLGNPGMAIKILEAVFPYGINNDSPPNIFSINPSEFLSLSESRKTLLREILVKSFEFQNETIRSICGIHHKDLMRLLDKSKATITHHLKGLVDLRLVIEELETNDKRKKHYKPNFEFIELLEEIAFRFDSFNYLSLIKKVEVK